MAQYKVPQDVEADDKLIGPFSFRQFVYIMIAFGLAVACFFLWQIFPLLIFIPIPIIIFLGILALPLKKDQPMETYLSAVIDFYTKPQKRYWMPGQVENSIIITAPKQTEQTHTKGLSQEEVSRRLSFLADVVDTEGRSIHDSNLRDDVAAEANTATDIFETGQTYGLDKSIQQSTENHHRQLVERMRNAIDQHNNLQPQMTPHVPAQPTLPQPATPAQIITPAETPTAAPTANIPPIAPPQPTAQNPVVIQPDLEKIHEVFAAPKAPKEEPKGITEDTELTAPEPTPIPDIPEPEPKGPEPAKPEPKLGNDDNQEVYISLH